MTVLKEKERGKSLLVNVQMRERTFGEFVKKKRMYKCVCVCVCVSVCVCEYLYMKMIG